MTATLQDHLFVGRRAAEPLHDAFLSRGRLPKHISDRGGGGRNHKGGWKTESIAKYYVGAASGGQVGSKRKYGQSYANFNELPLSPQCGKLLRKC